MNKWLYRAVGVASGALLLGGGVAHAGAVNEADRTVDPQTMRGLLADLFTPTGGQHHLGLSIDIPADRASTGTLAHGPDAAQPATNRIGFAARTPGDKDIFVAGMFPDLSKALPNANVFPQAARKPELLPGLGVTSGAGGNGGLLGGLTGGAGGGSGLIGGLTGGLTGGGGGASGLLGGLPLVGSLTGGGGGASGLLGGLPVVGGLTGGGGGASDLLGGLPVVGGLTGGGGPLAGLTGDGGPLTGLTSGITGGLANSGGPLSGITGMLGAQDDDVTFDDADLSALGTPGPVNTDVIDPALRGTSLDTTDQRPVVLNPDLARQVNDVTSPMVSALIADAMTQQLNTVGPADDFLSEPVESHEEGLPLVGGLPVVGDLLGDGGPLSQFLVVGDVFQQLPVVKDLTGSGGIDLTTLDRLPIVSKVLSQGLLQSSDSTSLPVIGGLPFIGKLTEPLAGGKAGGGPLGALTNPLSALGGLTGGASPLSALGGLTGGDSPLGALGGLTGGASPLGALGGLTGGDMLGGLTGAVAPAPAAMPMPAPVSARPVAQPQAPARIGIQRPAVEPMAHVGKHRALTDTVRPMVNDPEYAEESLPLLGALTGGGDSMGALPLSTLVRQLPLASELPLVGQLTTPMQMLKSLPVLGGIVGMLPIE